METADGVRPKDVEACLSDANQLQAVKANTLMRSINKLQKENISLQKSSRESNRTAYYKKIQHELGQQDVLIDTLRCCIGTEKAQELMLKAIESLEVAAECADCQCREELFRAEDGAWLCRRCYTQRAWKELHPDVERKACDVPKYPDSKDKLEAECRALQVQLSNTKRLLKPKKPLSAPKSASFNTAAALANVLAGYVQRADHMEKENASLRNQRDQLEQTVKEQEEDCREQMQQLEESGDRAATSASEDLQSRIRLRSSEIDRVSQVVSELLQQLGVQKEKHLTLKSEIDAAQHDIQLLRQEMSAWTSKEDAEQAKRLDKLRHSKEQKRQDLKHSREQLKGVRDKLKQSIQTIGHQKAPLEVETRIKAQARSLILALRDVEGTTDWSKFWSQVDVGLESDLRELLDQHPLPESLEELKTALYRRIGSDLDSGAVLRLRGDLKALAESKLAALEALEERLQQEERALEELRNVDTAAARTSLEAALKRCDISREPRKSDLSLGHVSTSKGLKSLLKGS